MTDEDLSTQMMQLGVSRVGAALVLSVAGDIDLLTAPRLSDTVKAALNDAEAGEPVVVDLSGATFLDSHGLAILDETSSALAPRTGSPLRVVIGDARRVTLPSRSAAWTDDSRCTGQSRMPSLTSPSDLNDHSWTYMPPAHAGSPRTTTRGYDACPIATNGVRRGVHRHQPHDLRVGRHRVDAAPGTRPRAASTVPPPW